ncbi:MAG: TBCC domain-containing protein [Mediterranea sp.]|jgi:hypothetical protein|nr:TBCC domain-containing protein [Mediterranea sp.]
MKPQKKTPAASSELRCCRNCNEYLPTGQFRVRNNKIDYLCVNCRIQYEQERYQKKKRQQLLLDPLAEASVPQPSKASRLVITEVPDRDTRIALIKQAFRRVQESIERRQRREKGEE